MAQLPTPFNAHSVDPAQVVAMLPLSGPEGHHVMIVASEFKAAKSGGNNGYLELTLQVLDGIHKGEQGAYRLNIFHDNPKTVEIASRQLSALCYVTGQMMISDSAQLHNIPFCAVVSMQKKQLETDPDYTEIKGVLDIQGNKPGKAGSNGSPAPATSLVPAAPAAPQAAPAWAQAPAAPQAAPVPQGSAPVAPPWAR